MKMDHSNWTLRFPRTTKCDGYAIHRYRIPLHKRVLFLLIHHGWLVIIPALIAAIIVGFA